MVLKDDKETERDWAEVARPQVAVKRHTQNEGIVS